MQLLTLSLLSTTMFVLLVDQIIVIVFENQDLQMFRLKLNKVIFTHLILVDRGNETQRQMGEILDYFI